MRLSHKLYVFEAEVLCWAAHNRLLVTGNSQRDFAGAYTIAEAVTAAMTGELEMAVAASQGRPIYVPLGATMPFPVTAAQHALALPELVGNIVRLLYCDFRSTCTHPSPNSSLSCCTTTFASLARVNTTFFREVTPVLWSCPERLSNLTAVLWNDPKLSWYNITQCWQDLWVCPSSSLQDHSHALCCRYVWSKYPPTDVENIRSMNALKFFSGYVEELRIGPGELPLPTLRYLSDLRLLNPTGTMFPRLRRLVWTMAAQANDFTNLNAFLCSSALTEVSFEFSYGPEDWSWYMYSAYVTQYAALQCPHLRRVSFVPSVHSSTPVMLPASALRAFGSLDHLVVHVVIKGSLFPPIPFEKSC